MPLNYYQPNSFVSQEGYTIYDVVRTFNDKILILCSDLPQDQLDTIRIFLQGDLTKHTTMTHDFSGYHQSYLIFIEIPPLLINKQDPLEVKVVIHNVQNMFMIAENLFFDIP